MSAQDILEELKLAKARARIVSCEVSRDGSRVVNLANAKRANTSEAYNAERLDKIFAETVEEDIKRTHILMGAFGSK